MLRSIATVSLGGTLVEKLTAIAAAGFDGIEIFENDLLYFDGSPRRGEPAGRAISACAILLFQPFRDFEAVPRDRMEKQPRPRRAQVRHDGAARRRPDAGAAATSRRTRSTTTRWRPPTCAHWASARRGAASASATRRWPGAATSTPSATPGSSCRQADHPAVGLVVDSFHTFAIDDDDAPIARHPRRPHLLRPARRRAEMRLDRCRGAGISATSPDRARCR